MPELADIEGWRRYLARYAEGRRVRGVRATDAEMLRNTSPQGLGRALEGMGRVLRVATRHGRLPDRRRWLQSVREQRAPRCPRCGSALERTSVASRTAPGLPELPTPRRDGVTRRGRRPPPAPA